MPCEAVFASQISDHLLQEGNSRALFPFILQMRLRGVLGCGVKSHLRIPEQAVSAGERGSNGERQHEEEGEEERERKIEREKDGNGERSSSVRGNYPQVPG